MANSKDEVEIKDLETTIDKLVYSLYDLSESEIKLVENNIKLTAFNGAVGET